MNNLFYKLLILIPALLILNSSFIIHNCSAQWVQMSSGMPATTVFSLATLGNNIFAGTEYGVYLSTNNGTNWTQTALYFPSVFSLATLGNNIFAGTSWDGVYLSTNNGTNWTQTALNNTTGFSLATLGNNIFAGTSGYGVFISTNNGTTWTQTALNNKVVYSLATLGNNIFAGTSSHGVYLSTNNGTTWTQTALYYPSVFSLATLVNNIFAGTLDYGVYLSTNNGTTWTQTALNNKVVLSLAVSGNNIFAGTSGYGVYLSTNNGANWIEKNQGFNYSNSVDALLIANNYIFAGTGQSVWRRSGTEIIGIKQISELVPSSYSLEQNYPNPFNPNTKIRFAVKEADGQGQTAVKLIIFDALGREVAVLVNEKLSAGTYEAVWDASQYPSGVYFYKLTVIDPLGRTNNFNETKKMLMIK